jgi:YVTN family beta-propeller protein
MVRTTIAVNALAFIAVNPATNRIYDATGDPNHGQVIVVDGNTDQVLTTINFVGSTTSYVGVDPVRNLIYASNASSVAVINGATNTVLKKIKLPGTPADVSINPVTRLVYVANNALNEVQVIDGTTNTLTKTAIPVGNGPDFTAIDIYRGLLLVANSSEGIGVAPGGPSVSIISLSQ